jgi:sugar/nucleoside kinase (ribokinase family)
MRLKGLFIGLTTLDIQYFVTEHPVANSKVKASAPEIAAGGPAANAAIAFALLNGSADFLSCVGKNHFTSFIISDFEKHGVKLIDAFENNDFAPVTATVITNTNTSDRTIVTHHPEKNAEQNAQSKIYDIKDYNFVFTDGFYPELSIPLLKLAKQNNIPVIFDGGSWKPQMPDLLPLLDIAVFSSNFNPPNCNSVSEIFEFLKSCGIAHYAISQGDKPILIPGQEINVQQVHAVDSLAAGDFLHGALCWYYMQTKNFVNSLSEASLIASFSTQYKGTRQWINQWKNR